MSLPMTIPPIVLTRPAGRGEDLVDALRGKGYPVQVIPLLRLSPLPLPDLRSQPAPDQLIFISPSAVEFALSAIPEHWWQAGLFAVGRGTAQALPEPVRTRAMLPMPETSEGLLELDALRAVQGQTVVIVRGQGGREHLANTLRQRGAEVRYMEVYERLGPEPEQLASLRQVLQQPAILVVTSGEALAKLCAIIAGPALKACTLIVVSERLAEMAAPYCPQVVNARGADTDSLRLALDRVLKQRQGK